MAFIPVLAHAGWQNMAVYIIVACCVLYAIFHSTRFFRKKGNGCSNCPHSHCCCSSTTPHRHKKGEKCHETEKAKKNCCG